MLDIVIDTNVMVHAQNPNEGRFQDSINLLELLRNCPTRLCVDTGFSLDEPSNRSRIGSEYLAKLNPGSVGYTTVQMLAGSGRIRIIKPKVEQSVKKLIEKLVKKGSDRVFAKVAYVSADKTLVSHDYEDFPESTRLHLEDELAMTLCEAVDASELLADS